MIAIVNGCGNNIASVQFALARLGKESVLTTDVNVIQSASHVILPGVSMAKQAMSQLQNLQLIDVIRHLKQPVLGICLGMQILYEFSQEGEVNCLNIVPGKVAALPQKVGLTLPHMGWNKLHIRQNKSVLMQGVAEGSYVYYVHSYAAPLNDYTVAVTQHGVEFSGIVQYKNFHGVQFHPERSGKVGERILQNFLLLEITTSPSLRGREALGRGNPEILDCHAPQKARGSQ